MKTQKNKLAFTKHSITELNDTKLLEISGGTSPACAIATIAAAAAVAVAVINAANDLGVAVGEAISREID